MIVLPLSLVVSDFCSIQLHLFSVCLNQDCLEALYKKAEREPQSKQPKKNSLLTGINPEQDQAWMTFYFTNNGNLYFNFILNNDNEAKD